MADAIYEVDEYDEWRLTGQPDGDFPLYKHVASTPENVEAIQAIFRKILSGDYRWTDAKLERRRVRIQRGAWLDAEAGESALRLQGNVVKARSAS